jgi:hypothetical protein
MRAIGKLVLTVACLLVTSGCVTYETVIQTPLSVNGTDSVFLPYIERFQVYTKIPVPSTVIAFSDRLSADTEKAGTCIRYTNSIGNYNRIDINETVWKELTDLEKEQLVFHELGHCVIMRKGHIDAVLANGCPQSLMSTKLFGRSKIYSCYDEYHGYYIEELVKGE